jgi:probable HAF family extracellular repeat protein
MNPIRHAVVAVGLALSIPTLISAASYNLIDLGTLGGSASAGLAINNSGHVTGWATKAGGGQYAFLYDGAMHDLLGTSPSAGQGINDSGLITGWALFFVTNHYTQHAFLFDGAVHDLGTLGGGESAGNAINAAGQITGWAQTADNLQYAFRYDGTMHNLNTTPQSGGWSINDVGQITGHGNLPSGGFLYNGTLHDIGTLGGTSSEGRAINATGVITGYSLTDNNAASHVFLYDGIMHDLGTLGGPSAIGLGINNSGQIVGHSKILASGDDHAFIYDSINGMVDLNSLIDPMSGWILNQATAINESGQITGSGMIDGEMHAFVLTPVPEPSTTALLALGGLTLLIYQLRARWRR